MILFVPSGRYHVQTFAYVAPYLTHPYRFADISQLVSAGGTEEAQRLGLPIVSVRPSVFLRCRPSVAVFMNDWGPHEREMVLQAKRLGILTLGLVEGAQDYEDTHIAQLGVGQRRLPYQTVDIPFLMGAFDKKYLSSPAAMVTGCPRMDALLTEQTPPANPPVVLINSNFSYGLYTHVRDAWVRSAVQACESLGYDYMITVHPADQGDFSAYKDSVTNLPLYDAMRLSTVLVSRFSTAIFEAMALGRQVVYYNPHGETQPTFRDPMGAFPVAKSPEELKEGIQSVLTQPQLFEAARLRLMEHHLGPLDGKASQRVASAIEMLASGRRRLSYPRALSLFPSLVNGWISKHFGKM